MEKLPKLVKTSIKDVKHSEIVFSEIVSQFFFWKCQKPLESFQKYQKLRKIFQNWLKATKKFYIFLKIF